MAASSSSFLASPFLGFTEHWTELESENEPPRKRKCLSLRRRANRARPANYRRRTAGRCTKWLALFPWLRETLSLERRLVSLSVSVLRPGQSLKPPPLKNTMHGDDWMVQTNLLAIDFGHVVRLGSLCEAFAQEAD